MAQSESRKSQLIRGLDQDRKKLQRHAQGIRSGADLSTRFQKSFSSHTLRWLGASALAGMLLSFVRTPRSKKKPVSAVPPPSPGFAPVGFLFRSALEMSKPFLLQWATQKIQVWVQKAAEQQRPPFPSADADRPGSKTSGKSNPTARA
jgi:hypothetical protein